MISEKEFFTKLADVPDLPAGLYGKIDRTVRRRHAVRLSAFALAAGLAVAVGVSAMFFSSRPGGAVPPELADELQSVNEYVNGGDLDQELAMDILYEEQ